MKHIPQGHLHMPGNVNFDKEAHKIKHSKTEVQQEGIWLSGLIAAELSVSTSFSELIELADENLAQWLNAFNNISNGKIVENINDLLIIFEDIFLKISVSLLSSSISLFSNEINSGLLML